MSARTSKENIKKNFSASASYYDRHAGVQKETALRLSKALEPWQYSIVEGPIVEVGAGTGFFTKYLLEMFTKREIIISDLSPEMVRVCRKKFGENKSVNFCTLDAEKDEWPEKKYSLIVGNFVAQWLKHPSQTLSKMATSLKPGGLLLMSFPGSESFSNWREYCIELGLPFTANSLPDVEQVVIDLSMGPVKVDFYEDDMTETYKNVFEFFEHLKESGTSTSFSGKKLTVKQLKLLNRHWLEKNGGKVNVQYHTAFIAVKRDLK